MSPPAEHSCLLSSNQSCSRVMYPWLLQSALRLSAGLSKSESCDLQTQLLWDDVHCCSRAQPDAGGPSLKNLYINSFADLVDPRKRTPSDSRQNTGRLLCLLSLSKPLHTAFETRTVFLLSYRPLKDMSEGSVVINLTPISNRPPFPPSASLHRHAPKLPQPVDFPSESTPSPEQLPGNLLLRPGATISSYLRTLLHPVLLSGSLYRYLWLAGEPHNTRALHELSIDPQCHRLIPTTDINQHLVSSGTTLFLKPLPDFLLSHTFWVAAIQPDPVLDASARGLLHSWCLLIPTEESFRIAKKHSLLPRCVRTWQDWAGFVWTLQRDGALAPEKLDRRYLYGELELEKLDFLRMFFVDGMWYDAADVDGMRRYQQIFGRVLSWTGLVLLLLYAVMAAYGAVGFMSAVRSREARYGQRWLEGYAVGDVRYIFFGHDAACISYFVALMVLRTIHAAAGVIVSGK